MLEKRFFSPILTVGEYVEMIASIEHKNIIWINPSRPFATEFATAMHI